MKQVLERLDVYRVSGSQVFALWKLAKKPTYEALSDKDKRLNTQAIPALMADAHVFAGAFTANKGMVVAVASILTEWLWEEIEAENANHGN